MQNQLAATDHIILAACLSVDYWHQSCSFLHSLPRIIKFRINKAYNASPTS